VHLCQCLMAINLVDELAKFVWKLTAIGEFTVMPMYAGQMNVHISYLLKYL
jgi:hypothetical protein